MNSGIWECSKCHGHNPESVRVCIHCEAAAAAAPASAPQRKGSKPGYLAWVALLPPLFAMVYGISQFSRVGAAVSPGSSGALFHSKRLACVETYGVTLDLSEYYVPEWSPGIPATNTKNAPQISTLLRGMARNDCGETLKNVNIRFVVHDDAGKKGDGYYLIEEMAVGEVKSFERAWMGRVTSYEVAASQ